MTTQQSIHETVGAYSLGLLTPAECDAFEAHLASCERCAVELEQLMEIAAVLPEVDEPAPQPAVPAVAAVPAPALLPPRRAARTQRAFALVAGVVLIAVAALGVVGGVVGQRIATDDPQQGTPTAAADPFQGEVLSAVDPDTGVRARTALSTKGWGTNVTLELSGVRGPLNCTLVAVDSNGGTETAMTWQVPVKGYGTAEQPDPLVLAGGSSFARSDLDRFEVQTSDGQVLVSIPA